jgi:sugar phosphate isomerase/epimerase
MMDRRSFIGTVTAATLLSDRLTWAADHKIPKIGLQLYTVRDTMESDLEGTIAKVASIGYKEVELAGFEQVADGTVSYYKHTPQELKAVLDKHGLVSPSTHVQLSSMSAEKFPKVIESSKALGHSYIICPFVDEADRKKPDIWKTIAATLNRAGAESKKAGIQLGYHNHWFEYLPTADGKLPYDLLLAECDANLVKFEMDLCWITTAGKDPIAYFNKYPGRFPCVHVKDIKTMPKVGANGNADFGDTADLAPVGSGIINWKNLFGHAEKAGIKHYFVEHDKPKDAFDSIASSYAYLSKLTF